MLRTFTAALLATALIAGPALAAQPSSGAASTAAATAAPAQAPAKQANETKPVKTVKHARAHSRKHVAHVVKPGNAAKTTKSSA
jgi:hypothetical protein